MAQSRHITYRALIKPIPAKVNLENVMEHVPTKTCKTCSTIVPDRSRLNRWGTAIKCDYERVDTFPDFPDLKASAKAGCDLCRLFRQTIRAGWAVRPMEELGLGPLRENDGLWDDLFEETWDQKVKIYAAVFILEKTLKTSSTSQETEGTMTGMVTRLHLEFGPANTFSTNSSHQHDTISQIISFKVFDSQDLQVSERKYRRRLPSSRTLSLENLELVHDWISDCKNHHLKCHLGSATWVPSRLLDVGPLDGSKLPALVETKNRDIQGPYATLSHMWGSSIPLRTLKANYEELKVGIPIWKLSKNFAQAVILTRELGLRHLWIDSLCIIQDLRSDWNKEAATMHQVYSHAEVTIVATSAISTHDGFLQRNLSIIPATKIIYDIPDISGNQLNSMILTPQDDVESGLWFGDVEACTWNTRGWTLQERSLSTRMLHFCRNKMYFECRTCRLSEEAEAYVTPQFELWPRDSNSVNLSSASALEDKEATQNAFYKRWTSIVTAYSRRKLTKGFDKLVAIQSVAAEMALVIGDSYISFAGSPCFVQPENFRAPSWSWASLDGPIRWAKEPINPKPSHSLLQKVMIEILGFGNEVPGLDCPLLRVKAVLMPITAVAECGHEERWLFGTRNFPYDIFMSHFQTQELSEIDPGMSSLTLGNQLFSVGRTRGANPTKFAEGHLDMDDKDELTKSRRELFYLHVQHTCRPSGLILERETGSDGVWKRVGAASVFGKDDGLFLEQYFNHTREPQEVIII